MYADVTLSSRAIPMLCAFPQQPSAVPGDAHFVFAVRGGVLPRFPPPPVAMGEWLEIASGLSADDSVVANMGPMLAEGVEARAVLADPSASTAPAT